MSSPLAATTRIGTVALLRDPRALFFAVVFPFCFIGMFAFMRTLGVGEGDATIDPMVWGIPAVLVMAFASLVIYGTVQPLVTWRRQGTLRLLSTTPLSRSVFLAGLAPVRIAVGIGQSVLAVALAAAFGVLAPSGLGWFLLTSVVALVFFCAVGVLLASIFDSPEVVSSVGGGLLPIVLMASGVLLPPALLPNALQRTAQYNPVAVIGDLLRADLTGAALVGDRLNSYLLVVGAAALLFAMAVPLFSWERRADRRAATA